MTTYESLAGGVYVVIALRLDGGLGSRDFPPLLKFILPNCLLSLA
jgi:hypothetical protein